MSFLAGGAADIPLGKLGRAIGVERLNRARRRGVNHSVPSSAAVYGQL